MSNRDSYNTTPRRPRLMVAEDDVEMAHVFRFLFEREGFEVVAVTDGRQAVERIHSDAPPTVMVVDIMMPFVNGFQVIREARRTAGWEQVPVVAVSGKSSEQDVVEAIEAGADDYVTKPFRPKELVARVRGLLERRAGTRVA